MSVQNQTPFNSYTANGATTVFPFTFLLLEAGDLIVEVDGVVQSTGFTLAGVGAPAGGSVTFTVAPANGLKVLLKRVLTLQRLTDYQNNGDLLAATLNKDFDRIWQSMQQLQQNDIRALKLPFDTPADQVIPEDAAARANKGVKFDGSGNLILSNFDPDGAQDDATAAAATATTQAGIATTQAGIATTQAGIATTKAGESAASAASVGFTLTDLQTQGKTAVTSAGTAPNFTATTSPAYGAYVAGQRMRVKFHAAGTTGSNTLNRDGLGAKNLKQYDSTGAKVAAVVTANQLADVEYDGTDMVILDPLPPAAAINKQVFTGSGTFTIPSNATAASVFKFSVVGGGGGGGGYGTNGSGGGGGAGATAIKYLSGLTAGNTITVTVGGNGTGGAGDNNGGNGSASSISSGTQAITTVTANGGGGGLGGGSTRGDGGTGGAASNSDINMQGGAGANRNYANAYWAGGVGGSSTVGGGGQGSGTGSPTSGGFGGGGGGGGTSGSTGANGGQGCVIVEWVG